MSISKLKRWMLERTPEVRSNSLEDKLQQRPQHIAILAQVVDQKAIDDIKAYISKYTKDGKKVSCLLHTKDKRIDDDFLLERKQVKWSGEPACNKTTAFLSESYDLLYVPCKEYGLTLEYLIKKCDAQVKAGVYDKARIGYFDIAVDTNNEEIAEIIKEIDAILNKLMKHG